MPRRTRNGKNEVYVNSHKWRNGKAGRHPGYWRPLRPKGRKLKVGDKPVELYPVRDQYGHLRGWKRKRR